MKIPSHLKRLLLIAGLFAMLWLTLIGYIHSAPVVVLHYSAAATKPVDFLLDGEKETVREMIDPGASLEFRTPHRQNPNFYVIVSLPFASGDGVEIKQPFSRVDVYIGADTRIARTVTKTNFLARFGFE